MTSNQKSNTSFTFTTFRAYEVKVALFFRLEAVLMLKTAFEKGQLWRPREPRVFNQMTSDQVHVGPEHILYHQIHPHRNRFQLTRPNHIVKNYNGYSQFILQCMILLLLKVETISFCVFSKFYVITYCQDSSNLSYYIWYS